MSRLRPSDFNNVVTLIEAVSALGAGGCGGPCGFTCDEINASFRLLDPTNPISDAELDDLKNRAANSGVLTKQCSAATDPEFSQCADEVVGPFENLFAVNQNMVGQNMHNKVYADFFNGPTTASSNYDPCVAINDQGGSVQAGGTGLCNPTVRGSANSVCTGVPRFS
jgi:hypothetical protein